jgi:isopropylmalate/homocitrate/citramalate synthase
MIENNRYQTINPSDFGFKLKFNIGHAVTGWQGVKSWIAKQLKIFLDDKQAKNLSQEIREYTSIKGPFLEDKRLREFIYRSLRLCRVTSLSMTMAERSRSHQKLNITNEN